MRGLSACERVFVILDRKPTIEVDKGQKLSHVKGTFQVLHSIHIWILLKFVSHCHNFNFLDSGQIEFKNVDFSYPNRKFVKVLQNINITLEQGKVHSLVGPSGSGKSTIASVISLSQFIERNTLFSMANFFEFVVLFWFGM